MNLGTIKQAVLAALGREPNVIVYEMVTADVNNALRVAEMIRRTGLAASPPTSEVILPSDCLEVASVLWKAADRPYPLPLVSIDEMQRRRGDPGLPLVAALIGPQRLALAPEPDRDVDMEVTYYGAVTAPVADSDENEIMARWPMIYVYGAMAHHAALIADPEEQRWRALYQAAIGEARAQDRERRMSEGIAEMMGPRVVA